VTDVVDTAAEARTLERPPLLVLDAVRAFLDAHGLGSGGLAVARTGEGRSNFTFVVERDGGERFVLRRPPRPPYPPSAHDMVREARLQLALAELGIRVPRVVAVCEDESVLGVPFYVMDFVAGDVVTTELPAPLDADEAARRRLGDDLVDLLAQIHAADVDAPGLAPFRRGGDYLERQLRRFTELWPRNATRPVPAVDEVGARLAAEKPAPVPPTVVHGDFRLGNMIVAGGGIVASLDWEMGAIGDPRADLGYLVATWTEPGGLPSPIGGSPATAAPGFPSKRELAERYARVTGRDVGDLGWFVAFALWKAAIFCEAIYGRWVRGELAAGDDAAAIFERGVPLLAETALAALGADRNLPRMGDNKRENFDADLR
jgi:aminoglycoside phosphotransferase (APT) family kinase protein